VRVPRLKLLLCIHSHTLPNPAPHQGPTAIRNVYNWRVKETERMVAIVTELTKLGAKVGAVLVAVLRSSGQGVG
jgi:hypothetical protein